MFMCVCMRGKGGGEGWCSGETRGLRVGGQVRGCYHAERDTPCRARMPRKQSSRPRQPTDLLSLRALIAQLHHVAVVTSELPDIPLALVQPESTA